MEIGSRAVHPGGIAVANQMKEFTMKQEAEQIAAASKNVEKNRQVEPNMGVPGAILFAWPHLQ